MIADTIFTGDTALKQADAINLIVDAMEKGLSLPTVIKYPTGVTEFLLIFSSMQAPRDLALLLRSSRYDRNPIISRDFPRGLVESEIYRNCVEFITTTDCVLQILIPRT